MQAITKRTAAYYSAWVLVWLVFALVGNATSGHGEYAISSHLVLSFTGFPLALLSWNIHPYASILGISVAGLLGVAQWSSVAEGTAFLAKLERSRRRDS